MSFEVVKQVAVINTEEFDLPNGNKFYIGQMENSDVFIAYNEDIPRTLLTGENKDELIARYKRVVSKQELSNATRKTEDFVPKSQTLQ